MLSFLALLNICLFAGRSSKKGKSISNFGILEYFLLFMYMVTDKWSNYQC